MPDLSPLIDRLRKAEDGDKLLDEEIMCSVGGYTQIGPSQGQKKRFREPGGDFDGHYVVPEVPRVTSNIDAALALVERLLPEQSYWIMQDVFDDLNGYNDWVKRLPIAILTALLVRLNACIRLTLSSKED